MAGKLSGTRIHAYLMRIYNWPLRSAAHVPIAGMEADVFRFRLLGPYASPWCSMCRRVCVCVAACLGGLLLRRPRPVQGVV